MKQVASSLHDEALTTGLKGPILEARTCAKAPKNMACLCTCARQVPLLFGDIIPGAESHSAANKPNKAH